MPDLEESKFTASNMIKRKQAFLLTFQNLRFVWLVPKWSLTSSSAVSNIRIIIQDQQDPSREDLAKGAGGEYRYLQLETDGSENITDVQLLRREDSVSDETVNALGFDGCSGDINRNRGGDYLYLVWKNH